MAGFAAGRVQVEDVWVRTLECVVSVDVLDAVSVVPVGSKKSAVFHCVPSASAKWGRGGGMSVGG